MWRKRWEASDVQSRQVWKQWIVFPVATAALVLAAYLAREWIDPILGSNLPFVTFFVAVGVAIWRIGLWSAVAVTIAGYVIANYHFIPPRHILTVSRELDAALLAAYFSVCGIICVLGQVLRREKDRAEVNLKHVSTANLALEQEVTRRRAVEKALSSSETLLRGILDHLPVGVWLIDEKGNIVLGNPASWIIWSGARYVGLKEFGQYKAWTASGKRIEPEEWAGVRAISKGEVTIDEELEIECFDGQHKRILNSAIPLRKPNGPVTGVVIVNQDITARKAIEAELLLARQQLSRQNEVLEESVARRTAELHETLHTLEGVLYHIAHDLRAPVRAMGSYSSLLIEPNGGALKPETRAFLTRIVEAAKRMDDLTKDLLLYGQIARNKAPVEPIRLNVVMEDCLFALGEEIRRKNAQVTVAGELPMVMGNEALLGAVFNNLISNAVKFVANKPPEVTIWAEESPDRWRINVKDNGVGIPDQYRAKIFNIFERIHTAGDFPGTGIGLAIAKKATQLLGGKIGFTSTPGEGSCFWIELPRLPGLETAP